MNILIAIILEFLTSKWLVNLTNGNESTLVNLTNGNESTSLGKEKNDNKNMQCDFGSFRIRTEMPTSEEFKNSNNKSKNEIQIDDGENIDGKIN